MSKRGVITDIDAFSRKLRHVISIHKEKTGKSAFRMVQFCKAQYSLREDGKVAVLNTGIKNGEPSEAKGKAKFTDTPRILRVSFFGPFYGDYRIMLLDEDYQWVLVGGSDESYLWILSRTPKLSDDVKETILKEATRRGYDVGKLIWVEQE